MAYKNVKLSLCLNTKSYRCMDGDKTPFILKTTVFHEGH